MKCDMALLMIMFVLKHELPKYGATLPLSCMCSLAVLQRSHFLTESHTDVIQCSAHFVQINTVLSVFTNKN